MHQITFINYSQNTSIVSVDDWMKQFSKQTNVYQQLSACISQSQYHPPVTINNIYNFEALTLFMCCMNTNMHNSQIATTKIMKVTH